MCQSLQKCSIKHAIVFDKSATYRFEVGSGDMSFDPE